MMKPADLRKGDDPATWRVVDVWGLVVEAVWRPERPLSSVGRAVPGHRLE